MLGVLKVDFEKIGIILCLASFQPCFQSPKATGEFNFLFLGYITSDTNPYSSEFFLFSSKYLPTVMCLLTYSLKIYLILIFFKRFMFQDLFHVSTFFSQDHFFIEFIRGANRCYYTFCNRHYCIFVPPIIIDDSS